MNKKIISFLLVFIFSLLIVGCSKEVSAPKVGESNSSKIVKEEGNDDIEDLKALYEFVKDQYSFEDFEGFENMVKFTRFDVTGNGTDEAILVEDNGMNPIIFVTVDNGKFEIIPSDVESGQYTTDISQSGNFIIIKSTGGGTGLQVECMDFAYYTGKEIKIVLDKLRMKYYEGGPQGEWEGEAQIDFVGNDENYENFNYNFNLYEGENKKHIQDIRKNYKFDKNTCTFKIATIDGGFDKTEEDNKITKEDTKTAKENNKETKKDTITNEKDSNTNQNDNNTSKEDSLLLKGKIVGYSSGDSGDLNTILLDRSVKIYGEENGTYLEKEVDRVWLEDSSIKNFIPREYFTYELEGQALKNEFIEKIPVEVEVDPNSISFVDFYTFAKAKKVISVDGETNPRDKSNYDYPIDYYKNVFSILCSEYKYEDYPYTADIKDYHFYKNNDYGDEFKVAVDRILESGLYINMLEGEYEIDTKKRYSEEGVGD